MQELLKRLSQKRKYDKTINLPKNLKEAVPWFSDILVELSPENLTGDGELPLEVSLTKQEKLEKEWEELELLIGKKVSEMEIISYWDL